MRIPALFVALAALLTVAAVTACTHTVEGTGGPGESTSATDPLPGRDEACDCADDPDGTCCDGDLVCHAPAGSLPTCNAAGCSRKGVCVARGEEEGEAGP